MRWPVRTPWRRRVVGPVAGLVAAACAGCDAPPPDLVLVSVDSLRADRLGCYGAERDTSPSIDAVAAAGAVVEEVVAPTSWTLPSHVTLLTGLPIPAHRVARPLDGIDDARVLLAEHLGGLGYRTGAVVSTPFLDPAYGFDRGFDHYRNLTGVDASGRRLDWAERIAVGREETGREVIDAAVAWLEAAPEDEPFFLFVHLWDVHYDYVPPAPYDAWFDPDYRGDLDVSHYEQNPRIRADMAPRDLEHLRALYDGEIRWTDSQIGRLVAALDARPDPADVVFSLVSDHGEEFFEHGRKGHWRTLFEESVRVPWIVRFPGRIPAGTRVGGVAGLADVAPTLLGLMGLPALPEAMGRDLSAGLRTGSGPGEEVLLTLGRRVALRGPDHKVVHRGRRVDYYDLAADPGERAPQPAREVAPDAVARLADRLRAAREHGRSLPWAGSGEAPIDAGTRSRLEALGYLGEDGPGAPR